jgi:GNAT superfamily N-acetyltransferase
MNAKNYTSVMDWIRAVLQLDRVWSAFALADLAPPYDSFCSWHVSGESLLLVYRAFSPPLLFALGPGDGVLDLMREVAGPEFYVSFRDGLLERFLASGWRAEKGTRLFRMVFRGGIFETDSRALRLDGCDGPAVEELFADGDSSGERPPFFQTSSLRDGIYFGVWEDGRLMAVAGTLVLSPGEGVACVGNVYVRRDRRGRGLAGVVSGAVTAELVGLGISTVALNVRTDNIRAIRAYERLGYVRYCEYDEALVVRV